jgi:DNA/RNA endonuclease YhcR with UshA esterase domain
MFLIRRMRFEKETLTMLTNLTARLNIFVLTLALAWLLSPTSNSAVKTTPITKTDLAAITTAMLDSNIEVEATVKSITPPPEGSRAPVRIELADDTGKITLVIWPDMYQTVKTQAPFAAGDLIHVNARVTTYRDNLQLQIHDASDVRVVRKAEAEKPAVEPTPAAPAAAAPGTTPLARVTAALLGKEVTVEASVTQITEPRSERAPYTVTLTQGDAHLPLVYWSETQKQLKAQPKAGDRVRVTAQVSEYRGTLQLRLSDAAGLTVLPAQ